MGTHREKGNGNGPPRRMKDGPTGEDIKLAPVCFQPIPPEDDVLALRAREGAQGNRQGDRAKINGNEHRGGKGVTGGGDREARDLGAALRSRGGRTGSE